MLPVVARPPSAASPSASEGASASVAVSGVGSSLTSFAAGHVSASSASDSAIGRVFAAIGRVARSETDFEQGIYSLRQLLVGNLKRVSLLTQHHKQTKNRWSRDDPAVTLLLMAIAAAGGLAFSVGLSSTLSFGGVVRAVVVSELLLLGVGSLVATAIWLVANRALRPPTAPHAVEQQVEWQYAFDVHCNASVPVLLLLLGAQYVLAPIVVPVSAGLLGLLLGNALYMAAGAAYVYFSFRGYLILPFLHKQNLLLLLVLPVVVLGLLGTLLGIRGSHIFLTILLGGKHL